MGGQTLGIPWLASRKSILQRGNPGPAIAVQFFPCPARKKRLKGSGLEFLAAESCTEWAKRAHIPVLRGKQPWESWCQCPGTVSETWTGDHRENRNVQWPPQCRDPTTLSHVCHHGAAPAPSPLWSLRAIKASFTKIPFTPAAFCHPSTVPGPVHAQRALDNITQGFPPKNSPFFFPAHP